MASSQSPDASPPGQPYAAASGAQGLDPVNESAEGANEVLPDCKKMATRSSDRSRRRRASSLAQSFINSSPPYGMWQATGEVASKVPTLAEIKHGAFSAAGWTEEGQLERRGFTEHQIHNRRMSRASSRSSSQQGTSMVPAVSREANERHASYASMRGQIKEEPATAGTSKNLSAGSVVDEKLTDSPITAEPSRLSSSSNQPGTEAKTTAVSPDETGTYPNGYHFPPKHTWSQSTMIGLKAFWMFFLTPFGFLVTIYGLNIVAWGAMLFFVLLQAAPAMCHPSCSDPYSARQIWIEIDSQILNALFCVTGFGLIPWRFRDFYYLMKWRLFGKNDYFRRLAGHNRSWFRLPGSDQLDALLAPPPSDSKKTPAQEISAPKWAEEEVAKLAENPAVPLPPTSMPPAPLTGARAPPTKPYLLDLVVWMYVLNTALQACLAGAMWGLTRFTRPSWVTGLLISLGCVVAIVAGVVAFVQGKKVKKIEGIPVVEEEVEVEVDAEKAQKGSNLTATKKVDRQSGGDEADNGSKGPTVGAGTEGEEPVLGLRRTETKTMKTKGGQWFERH